MKLGRGPPGLIRRASPPARGRGLKQLPFFGGGHEEPSPPARGRGLKHGSSEGVELASESPPARGRGLKLPRR